MDSVISQRLAIKRILGDYAHLVKTTSQAKQIDTVCLFDEVHDGYMVCRVGWERNKRINIIPLFIRIIDGKIWVEQNWTEIDLEQELMDAGILKKDICIGFHHPSLREPDASAVA